MVRKGIKLFDEIIFFFRGISFRGKTPKETFTEIYEKNLWKYNESISGSGSDNEQTKKIINEVGELLDKIQINSVLDIPCGDFKWMQKVDLSGINYLGMDIVKGIIVENNNKYSRDGNIVFVEKDLISDSLPKMDIIIIRDCFVHLCFEDICHSLVNVKSSESKYLLTTTFTNHPRNQDIITGYWRPLNLQQPPFNFPPPVAIINEGSTELNGKFKDKSMGLWEIKDLSI